MLGGHDDTSESTSDQDCCAVELGDTRQVWTHVDKCIETIQKLCEDGTIDWPVHKFGGQPEGERTEQI